MLKQIIFENEIRPVFNSPIYNESERGENNIGGENVPAYSTLLRFDVKTVNAVNY